MNLVSVENQAASLATHTPAPAPESAPAQVQTHDYRVVCLRSEEELARLCEPWTALMAEAPGAPVFQTWEWASAFWQHRDLGNELWVLAVWDAAAPHLPASHAPAEGRLAGLLPLMLVEEHRGPFRLRRLTFLGRGINYPVHLNLIARPDEEQVVARALAAYLDEHRGAWDVLDLGDMRADSPLRAAFRALDRPLRELSGAPARVSALPASWEIYDKDCLSSTRRKHLGQYRRKLEREPPGLVSFYEVRNPNELGWALDAMGELNKSRWHDRRITSAFDHPEFVRFHAAMAQMALDQGWLRFYVLRVGEAMAASVYGFLYGGVFYCYQLTFNRDWGKYGPGNLILGYAIEHAIAGGAREWNMMRGDQEYKLSWTDEERFDAHLLVAATLAGRIWLTGDAAFDKARAWGKAHLPENVRERITQFLSRKGLRRLEPAGSKHVSD